LTPSGSAKSGLESAQSTGKPVFCQLPGHLRPIVFERCAARSGDNHKDQSDEKLYAVNILDHAAPEVRWFYA